MAASKGGNRVSTPDLIALATGSRVVDLAHPMAAEMPQWPTHPPLVFSLVRRHGDSPRPGGYSSANEVIVTSGHTGTHLDGLGHVSCDGLLFGGLDAAAAQQGTRGLTRHGLETVAPIVRRGVLLDVARRRGLACLAPGERVTATDLAAAEAAAAPVRPGDVVLVRTGWARHWGDPARYVDLAVGWPGPDESAAEWLAERSIFATGADTITYERWDPSTGALPVHLRLIAGAGIHLLENMQLEELSALGAGEFLFLCLPLKFVGATGSPVRPVALVGG